MTSNEVVSSSNSKYITNGIVPKSNTEDMSNMGESFKDDMVKMRREYRRSSFLDAVRRKGEVEPSNGKSIEESKLDMSTQRDSYSISKQGYLRKENRHGHWRRKFFCIQKSFFCYYKSKNNFQADPIGEMIGSINLDLATYIFQLTHNSVLSRVFAIQATDDENNDEIDCHFFRACSSSEAGFWVSALKERRRYSILHNAHERRHMSEDEVISVGDEAVYFKDDSSEGEWWNEESNNEDSNYFINSGEASHDDLVNSVEVDDISLINDDANIKEPEQGLRIKLSRSNSSIESGLNPSLLVGVRNIPTQTFPKKFWHEPDVGHLKIRGSSYLKNRKKVPASQQLFRLFAMDSFTVGSRTDHMASYETNRVHRALARGEDLPFIWIVNFQVPGPPFYSCICYFAATFEMMAILFENNPAIESKFPRGFPNLVKRFFLGNGPEDDSFRNDRYKIIPRVIEGPRVVKFVVSSKPAIIGRRLKQRYFLTKNYMEMDIDIGANSLALKITKFALGYSKFFTLDISMVLESTKEDELPEQVMGVSRWITADLRASQPFSPTLPLQS